MRRKSAYSVRLPSHKTCKSLQNYLPGQQAFLPMGISIIFLSCNHFCFACHFLLAFHTIKVCIIFTFSLFTLLLLASIVAKKRQAETLCPWPVWQWLHVTWFYSESEFFNLISLWSPLGAAQY